MVAPSGTASDLDVGRLPMLAQTLATNILQVIAASRSDPLLALKSVSFVRHDPPNQR